ncbi:hypothetical protein ABPG77_006350 [Micractinium sp. CCAP 211/92]
MHAAALLLALLAAACADTAAATAAGGGVRRHLAAAPSAQPGTAGYGPQGPVTDGGAVTDHGSEALAATDHGGAAAVLFVPAPEPEAEPAVASENTAAASPPADEAAPAPASPVSPQGGQSLGSKLGVANGTAEAGKSVAQGAVAVAGTAGSAGPPPLPKKLQPPYGELGLSSTEPLDSSLPFYQVLLEPALAPLLPPAGNSTEEQLARQRLLGQLTADLAPVIDQVLNETADEVSALVDDVAALLPEGATAAGASAPMLLPAEVSAILSEPGVQEEIAGPVNATVAALASSLRDRADEAGRLVYAELAASLPPGSAPLPPLPDFLENFVPAFAGGFIRGVLQVLFGSGTGPAGGSARRLHLAWSVDSTTRAEASQALLPAATELAAAALGAALRRSLRQAGTPGQHGGVFISGTAVECSVDEACAGYHVQVKPGESPAEQAAIIAGAATQAALLQAAGAAAAASETLQAAAPAPEAEQFAAPSPEVEHVAAAVLPPAAKAAQAPPGGAPGAIQGGAQKAEQGVATAQNTTAAALGAAAGVAAGIVGSATNVTLGAAQAGAQVAQAVQGLVHVGKAVGQAVTG